MTYKIGPATVRALAALPVYPAFDSLTAAPAFDVSLARSGMLLVTYTQGAAKGAGTFPRLRMRGGMTATSLFDVTIEDASAPVDLGVGVGLQTKVRTTIKAFDGADLAVSYPIDLTRWNFMSFQFSEVAGGAPAGTLLAQLIIELDH